MAVGMVRIIRANGQNRQQPQGRDCKGWAQPEAEKRQNAEICPDSSEERFKAGRLKAAKEAQEQNRRKASPS